MASDDDDRPAVPVVRRESTAARSFRVGHRIVVTEIRYRHTERMPEALRESLAMALAPAIGMQCIERAHHIVGSEPAERVVVWAARPYGKHFQQIEVGIALEHQIRQRTLIVIVSGRADARTGALREAALASYRPGKTVITVDQTSAAGLRLPEMVEAVLSSRMRRDAAPAAYVCSASACANPVTTPGELVALVRTL